MPKANFLVKVILMVQKYIKYERKNMISRDNQQIFHLFFN